MVIRRAGPEDHAELVRLRALMLECAFGVELSSQDLDP